MAYLPIENYGVVGDLHTVALIGLNGSVDWLCFPVFDSPSVFGAILDSDKGGRFQIYPADDHVKVKQMYLPDTNVLITRFLSPNGLAELTDFMPVETETNETWNHRLVRRIKVVQGSYRFKMVCQPAFDYARAAHTVETYENGVVFHSRNLSLGLASEIPLNVVDGGAAVCEFTLERGQSACFMLHRVEDNGPCGQFFQEDEVEDILADTVKFWRKWISKCTYEGRWREMVHRSALVLKLLTFAPTGAIVAAPTTSLPENIGGERNWDYRYTWIRDASFTCYALLNLGFETEATRFMEWIEARCRELDPKVGGLQIMYGIDGRHNLTEISLDHLSGYMNSRPVRIGNGAYNQLQLDIYGELMDAVYLHSKYASPLSYDQWTYLRKLMDWLCQNWQTPDSGLWESRAGNQHYVYSRMMIWVALDRALRLARQRGLPADTSVWKKTRNAVYEEIIAKGWSDERKSFVQYYGSDVLDASNLLMPLVKFLGPTDPLMLSTLDRIQEELAFDALVYRYDVKKGAKDGLQGGEGTFCLCSFWLVECLTRAGRLDEARLKLEKMFSYANHLGLYAEEISTSGEMLGNYPQAFTHLSLITAAYNLNRALDKTTPGSNIF
ncbi:MAG: glycoside hydrolase family 15 protein [Chloroflexi bacterium]|nr:glycoside hydrolase family 15 protein [Chloroflexota bacterium]OJV95114.1 MAG: glucoamylase [Chloroflexi bacterium 54-19]